MSRSAPWTCGRVCGSLLNGSKGFKRKVTYGKVFVMKNCTASSLKGQNIAFCILFDSSNIKCLLKIQQQRQNIPPHPAKTSRHRSLVTVSLALRLSSSLELWFSVSQAALPFPLPFPFPLPYIKHISRLRKLSVWRSDRTLFPVTETIKLIHTKENSKFLECHEQ